MVRSIIKTLAFVLLLGVLFSTTHASAEEDGDFSIRLNMNGEDVLRQETITIDPERELMVDLQIFDVTRDVTLRKVSVVVTFAGQTMITLSENLHDFRVAVGETYEDKIILDAGEMLKLGDLTLITGIYRSVMNLDYTVDDKNIVWSEPKNIRILGNPLATPLGAAGLIVSMGTVVSILLLMRSLTVPSLPAGRAFLARASISSLPRLYDLAAERLEPTARGRIMGSLVKAAKGRIIKNKCPICDAYLKHGYCYTCKKSAKEVRNEYTDRIRTLASQCSRLLTSGEVATIDELCSRLGLNTRMGTDVIATLKNAKMVKIKGIVRKIMGKAVMAGIGSGLSTMLWVTVGGLVVLSSSAIAAILVASVVIPVTLTKSLQMRARRAIKRQTR